MRQGVRRRRQQGWPPGGGATGRGDTSQRRTAGRQNRGRDWSRQARRQARGVHGSRRDIRRGGRRVCLQGRVDARGAPVLRRPCIQQGRGGVTMRGGRQAGSPLVKERAEAGARHLGHHASRHQDSGVRLEGGKCVVVQLRTRWAAAHAHHLNAQRRRAEDQGVEAGGRGRGGGHGSELEPGTSRREGLQHIHVHGTTSSPRVQIHMRRPKRPWPWPWPWPWLWLWPQPARPRATPAPAHPKGPSGKGACSARVASTGRRRSGCIRRVKVAGGAAPRPGLALGKEGCHPTDGHAQATRMKTTLAGIADKHGVVPRYTPEATNVASKAAGPAGGRGWSA